MSSVSTINSTFFDNYSIEKPKQAIYWTSAKIKQVALYFFTAFLSAAAIIGACLSSSPFDLLIIFPILFSLFLGHKAYKIKDYDHPEKLKLYQQEAPSLTFDQLIDKHGLKNITEYKILSLETLKEKFNRQVQAMDFTSALNTYNVEELVTYQIATPKHMDVLRHLKGEADKHRAEYDAFAKDPSNADKMAKGRIEFHDKMNCLEEQYNKFKARLV